MQIVAVWLTFSDGSARCYFLLCAFVCLREQVYGTMIVPYVNMALNVVDVIAPYIVKILQVGYLYKCAH